PDSIEILNDLAITLSREGKLADAVPLYRRALKIRPGDPSSTRNLAIAYFKQQNYAEALRLLESLVGGESTDFQVLDLAGLCLFGLDRYPEAAGYLERATRVQPADLPALYILGQAYLRAGDYKAVSRVFGRILAINPESAEAH